MISNSRRLSFVTGLLTAAAASCAAPVAQAPAPASEAKAPLPVAPVAPPEKIVAKTPTRPERRTPDAAFRDKPPAPAPEAKLRLPDIKRFKLKNGLEVMLVEMRDLPTVSMTLVLKSGGGANPRKLAGLADLTANMLDEGTKTRSAMAIADQIAQLGATLSTGASWDASFVMLSTLSRHFDNAAAIWADVILNPSFDAKELSRVRENQLIAVARRKDSPPLVASQVTSRVLFGDAHPYAWPQTGVEESLKAVSAADLKKYHETFYRPNNAAVIVAGDVSETDLKPKLESLLGGWKRRPVPAEKATTTSTPDRAHVVLVDKAGAPQSSIRVASIGTNRASHDYFPLTMTNLILGGSFYRLDLNLRENKGWSYGVRSSFDMRRFPGPWTAGGEFDAKHTAEAVKEILSEIRLMRDADVTDDELRRAKDQLVRSFPARFATRAGILNQLAELYIYDLPESFLRDFTANVEAVSKQAIRSAAQKALHPERMAIVVVGDRQSLEQPLGDIAAVEVRDLDGAPAPVATKGSSQQQATED